MSLKLIPRAALLALLLLAATGCTRGRYSEQPPIHPNPNMMDQERANAQSKSTFFANGSTERPPVEGTVAQEWLGADGQQALALTLAPQGIVLVTPVAGQDAALVAQPGYVGTIPAAALAAFYTGHESTAADAPTVAHSPVPFTEQYLKHGQARYDIFCAPCHDAAGTGNGMTVQKGMLKPSPYTDERLLKLSDGDLYHLITNGVRNMPSYKHQIPVADRWAIVGYVRVLQLSQHASREQVPADKRSTLEAH